ncbi:hypothetical protein PG991_009028 [Apiospora marii]|uniref:Fungal-type protein kinase domain-containing protein n=1 Tax=Apiospora marii TaxID=335849 RepID=A0ABR1RJH4_9PEZI
MTLFDPLLGSDSQRSRLLPIDFAFVKAQGIMFSGKRGDEYQTSVTDLLGNLDNHISRSTRNWMESGYYIGISNCCALLYWGKESSSSIYETFRTRRKSGSRKEDDEQYKNREIPDPNHPDNAKALEQARCLADGDIDDDEKYFEVASMTDERKERVLWLGISIARHGKWLLYDDKSHQFSVPSRFEQGINIMSVNTEIGMVSELNLSRASTLVPYLAGNKAMGKAEKGDKYIPNIEDSSRYGETSHLWTRLSH